MLSVPAANSDTSLSSHSVVHIRRSRSAVPSVSALMDERLTGCSLRSSSSNAACRHQWACEGQKHLYIRAFYSCGVLLGARGRTGGGTRSPGCVASRGHHHCCVRLWNKDESIHCRDTLSIEHAHIGMWHTCGHTCVCVSLVQESVGVCWPKTNVVILFSSWLLRSWFSHHFQSQVIFHLSKAAF